MPKDFSPTNLDLLLFGNPCNLSCKHCFYREGGSIDRGHNIAKDLDTAKRIMATHKNSSIFLYPKEITTSLETADLFPLVGQKKVLSNGVILKNAALDVLKKAGVHEIKITLFANHTTHAMFNDISKDQYNSLLNNIVLAKAKGFMIVANTVITKTTIPTIPELAQLCSDLGIDKIEFLRLKPSGNARILFEHEMVEEPEMLIAVEMIERLKTRFPNVYMGYNLGCGPDFYKKSIEAALEKVRHRKSEWLKTDYMCPSIGMGYFGLSMRSGKIYGCLFEMEEKEFFLGTMDLETNGITIRKKNFLNPKVLSAKLRGNCHKDNCLYHEICLGGCRSAAHLYAKRRGEKDPFYAGMDVCITKCKEKLGL